MKRKTKTQDPMARKNMNTNIQRILELVQTRPDYAGAIVLTGENGEYVQAQFLLRNGALSNELIIAPIIDEKQATLSVCDLNVGKVPLCINGAAFCEQLNWRVKVGRFLCPTDSD